MKIGNQSKFVPVKEGLFEAVCVDVVDLGMVASQYGEKHKLKIVWEVSEKMADGRPFTIQQRYTASLSPKANLYKALKSWRGADFTKEELKSFEMDSLIGAPCRVNVEHNENDGNVYANVSVILKSENRLAPSGKYVRAKDRPDYKAPDTKEGVQDDEPDMSPTDRPF